MRYASSINDPTVTIGYSTHPGRTGKNNEDDYVVFETQFAGSEAAPPQAIQVAMVADGIGGNIAGETASHLAAENFYQTFKDALASPPRRRLVEAIEKANQAIYDRAISDIKLEGMGTTVVAAAIMGNELFVAHAGDSRAYLIRGGRAHQLTIDHTWAQEAVEAGRLSPERAKEHPNRHVIKRFLGIAPEVEVDTVLVNFNGSPVDSDKLHEASKSDVLRIQSGDTILLCSDGLTDVVSDKQIEQTLKKYNVQDAANQLIDLANKAGGPDNITVVMLQRQDQGAGAMTPYIASPRQRSPLLGIIIAGVLLVLAVVAVFLLGWLPGINQNTATPAAISASATAFPEPTIPVATPLPSPTEVVAVVAAPTETTTETATETATETVTATETPEATSTPVPDNATGEQNPVLTDVDNTGRAVATDIAQSLMETSSVESPTLAVTLTITIEPDSTNSNGKPPTSTPAPTFTDIPSATDTPTETEIPTRTKTPTPRPQATFTPTQTGQAETKTPIEAAMDGIPDITVQLISPNEGDTVQDRVTFSWKASAPLPSGYAFEPVFVAKGGNLENGQGFGGMTTQTELTFDLTKHKQGQLVWGVRLVIQNPYQPLKLVSGIRMINVKIPDTQPNNGGGNDAPSPVDPNRP